MGASSQAAERFIVLSCSDELVALPLSAVHRVLEVTKSDLVPVPRAPESVLGITNYWGRIVTVVELALLLDKASIALEETALPLIILEQGQRHVGIIANAITEVVTSFSERKLESRVDGIVSHMVEMNKRAVGVISVERLFASLKHALEAVTKV